MKDFQMGYAPAAREEFGPEDSWDVRAFPLGMPTNRVWDESSSPGCEWHDDFGVAVPRVVRECMTNADITGCFNRATDARERVGAHAELVMTREYYAHQGALPNHMNPGELGDGG